MRRQPKQAALTEPSAESESENTHRKKKTTRDASKQHPQQLLKTNLWENEKRQQS